MPDFTFSAGRWSSIPDSLREYDNWLLVDVSGERKPPVKRHSRIRSDPTHVVNLLSFNEAREACQYDSGERLAFQFSETPFFGLDFDNVASDKKFHPSADGLEGALRDSFPTYTEWSESSTGIHSVGRGSLQNGFGHKADLSQVTGDAHVEFYDSSRYFVFTGESLDDFPEDVCDCEKALHGFQERFLEQKTATGSTFENETDATVEQVERTIRAYADKEGHGLSDKAQKTLRLWNETPAREYEDSSSEDDASFVNLLYFWTKGDSGLTEDCWLSSNRADSKAQRDSYRRETLDFVTGDRFETFNGRLCK